MAEGDAPARTSSAAERAAYYERIDKQNLAPLWESLHDLVTPSPSTPVVPHRWDYDNMVRPYLMEAGRLITAKEAERRVLILENPGLRGQASVTHSLYAGVQMVLPGEVAPAHRHAQSALRFILEGRGAYTAVDGEPFYMFPGDLVLTPNWMWHDHGNETDVPIVWMDGLDIPLVRLLDASFAQAGNADRQAIARPAGDNAARYGANLLPVDWKPIEKFSPVFAYPYARTREVLESMAKGGDPDPCHGHKMRYTNPTTGGHVMPTIGAFIQLIQAGTATRPYRSTDGTVYAVVEGTGTSTIGDATFQWKPRDIFVAPSWAPQVHRADGDAVLFSMSDRPVQEALSLWREDRGQASAV